MTTNKERIEILEQGDTRLKYQHEETESSRRTYPSSTKIEFLRFGDDPMEWFNRVAQFFEFQRTQDQKVSLVAFHMEGEANQRWQWLNRTYKQENRTVTRTMFLDELWARFVVHLDYQREFEKLGNRVHGWTQKALICLPNPTKSSCGSHLINQRTSIVPKRLGWEEMQKRRAQGLCFNCNERFTPGHKCQGPRLLLIEGHDEVQDKEEEAEISDNREDELEVSIHALTGWASPRTMRVAATIKSQPIMVLIDSGSTHNFLSDKVARTLRLPVVPTKSFTVHVANGERLLCQGRFEKVPIDLQGIPFSLTCYSLPLAGLDMVLGIQWLEMLGSVVCNWQYLTMDFNWENQARRLQGIQGPIQATSLETIAKEHRQGHMVFTVYVQTVEGSSWDGTQPDMQQILGEFEDVFQEPFKLPPLREIDHHIPLKEGTQPINVRPYRYAYFQKAEIEKQVQAMLDVGIIRPSTSPYSSPVLLVKKKDDTWRFCTDYRALNASYMELHLNHVRKTLEILKKHNFFVKATKCDFGKLVLSPTAQEGNFKWDEDVCCIHNAQTGSTTTPTLAMPNFNEPFTIETDASGDGIGAVLTQQGRPIAYMSRALGVTKRSWSIYAKEMLAIVEAIRTWRPYILGRKFFIRTDQRSLKYFLEQRVATSEQQKWVAKLLGYDYEIIYRPGKENSAADALSRRPNSPLLNPIFISQVSLWDDIRKAAATDLYMKKIFQQAAHDPTGHYVVKNGLCFYKQRVVVPTALRGQLLQEFHDSKVAGHSGVLRTFKRLAQQFYWPSMYKNIQDYIQQCKDSIMVVVDRLSKYAHFIALSHPFSAKMIAEKFVENIIKLHGMPKFIIIHLPSSTDGQTEVVNRCSEQDSRCFVHQWPRKWFSYLSWAEYWYNTTYHYGLSRVNEVDQSLLTRDEVLQQLKTNLELAATRMKHVADQKRREVEFQIGDLVLLKLHPYRQHSVFKRAHQKLANRFYGPFPVEQKLGKVAYRLSLPPEAKIHPVFHVSLLKNYTEKVVNTRWIKRGTKFIEESLFMWSEKDKKILFKLVVVFHPKKVKYPVFSLCYDRDLSVSRQALKDIKSSCVVIKFPKSIIRSPISIVASYPTKTIQGIYSFIIIKHQNRITPKKNTWFVLLLI
ncbi:hypothetical protein AAG906_019980 [Vitis piasezkii]